MPFTCSYRPLAVGLGICAAELLAAVGISNALRQRLAHRFWRRVHYLTLPCGCSRPLHGVLAGTDRFDPWFAGDRRRHVLRRLHRRLRARFSQTRVPA